MLFPLLKQCPFPNIGPELPIVQQAIDGFYAQVHARGADGLNPVQDCRYFFYDMKRHAFMNESSIGCFI